MREKFDVKVDETAVTLIPYPYRGGLQEYAIELSRRLKLPLVVIASNNESVRVEIEELYKTFNKDLHVFYADFDVYRNPLLINLSRFRELRRILKEFEVVHFHGPFPFTGDFALHRLNYVFTYHFDIELESLLANVIARIYDNSLLKKALTNARVITATSKAFAEESRLLNKFKEKVVILPLGIDTQNLKPTYEYLSRIVFVGRIIPEKGIHVLLNAFERLAIEYEDLELFIIGKPVDTKYHRHLKELTKSKGMEGKVHFTGYLERNEMLRLLASSSVLVLPSLTKLDSFGIVILEASALAVPVVVSDVIPGAGEFVERARNGFVVRPGNANDLVRAIKKLLQNPMEYGERGRHYVTVHHDWSVVVDRARDILSSVSPNINIIEIKSVSRLR